MYAEFTCFPALTSEFFPLQNGDLKVVGMYIVMNVTQSGSRFCVLHRALYRYICTSQYAE